MALHTDLVEKEFEEWCALPNWLPVAKDGDGYYENESTRRFYACFEYAYKKGMWGAADKIDGDLCDKVGRLEAVIESIRSLVHPMREVNGVCGAIMEFIEDRSPPKVSDPINQRETYDLIDASRNLAERNNP